MNCLFLLLIEFVNVILIASLKHDAEFCERRGEDVSCTNSDELKLTRLELGEVGESRDVKTSDGRLLMMKTTCTKPHIFEIENFLTSDECEHFIKVAEQTGLHSSQTYSDDASLENGIKLLDVNQDMVLTLQEMKLTVQNSFDIYPDDEDLTAMYKTLKLDKNNDNKISKAELSKIKPYQLSDYLKEFIKNNPTKHSRYSKQAWLFPDSSTDDVFSVVQKRVAETVNLPLDLIKLSDFQVVKYGVHGHYNAHLDSSHADPKVPCCDRSLKTPQKHCRICRYMTVLFYLNDVDKGGETAFPLANNKSIDQTILHLDNVGHLFKKCDTANLKINAKKGKAVLWYNHFVNEETGWMGDVDEYTFHGGCPVIEGEKWIANFWIKTNLDKEIDIQKMKKVSKASDKYVNKR